MKCQQDICNSGLERDALKVVFGLKKDTVWPKNEMNKEMYEVRCVNRHPCKSYMEGGTHNDFFCFHDSVAMNQDKTCLAFGNF